MSEERHGVLDGAIAPAVNTRLFGHEAAEEFLARTYRSGKGHHAILIEGPEGIGKATLAFRFANHVLSHPDPATAPERIADPEAGSIVSRQIASGASHNLLYLSRPVDEKTGKVRSAITVDEVRRAGHFFSQTSGTGSWRIVIIDPADDLNRNAANAILKILEEPPKRAMFLVLSHAPGKLLPTIRSRCLPLKLSALSEAAMRKALGQLGLAIPEDQAGTVLSLSKGSVAQALKLANYGGADIIEAFRKLLGEQGPAARKTMYKLAEALSAKDSDVTFGFFTEHLGEFLMEQARTAALSGELARAEHYARLSSSVTEQLGIASAYNLERKQTILDILAAVTA
ncbi:MULTISPECIES: DNA polymerase III subunit delta' [Alphaproteobacteria]|uniref:DNA polymerase III subunit delta n=2 Tax=Alphaproteobacteria TaxID=28211 RepID=A0A512HD28_9HYPH|nr:MULTISPECIES: DNA polymerase III subunit delta' [Alphaproteobacteria]GEO83353.1 DNA polymerase III subunit delta' [Ciceribacter naphthalenivorans]GLR20253.1 DNA polymerase III subunit delta' [Ciceribacter naphthalenivorans]GLT03109.1 DNA polymerase III subunit delta' [Sphingomonas psychrolutea]